MTGLDLPAGWWGILVAAGGVLFPFAVAWRKGRVDESAAILSKWKELLEAHERRIQTLDDEICSLRDRLRTAEEEIVTLKRTILDRDEEIAGLKATIRQNSQSTGHLLGRIGEVPNTETARRLEAEDRPRRRRKETPE